MGCSILQQCSLKLLLGLFQITDAKEAGDYGRHNPSMLRWVFLGKSATQSSILAPRSAPIMCARLCKCSDSQNNCSCSMHQHGTKTEAGVQPGLETVVSVFCGLDELAGVWGKEDLGCTTVNLDILTMAPQTQNPTQVGPQFFVLSRYMGPCTTAGELGNTAQTRDHQHTDYNPMLQSTDAIFHQHFCLDAALSLDRFGSATEPQLPQPGAGMQIPKAAQPRLLSLTGPTDKQMGAWGCFPVPGAAWWLWVPLLVFVTCFSIGHPGGINPTTERHPPWAYPKRTITSFTLQCLQQRFSKSSGLIPC